MHDPEIVYCIDDIGRYVDRAVFKMQVGDKYLLTEFDTHEFNCATRWLLCNGDQQVAAYALPATCRPEGFLAAQERGTVVYLQPNEERCFTVRTRVFVCQYKQS